MLSRYNAIRARRARGEDQGFSLIELLVVVVIMGILIAIAVPVYLNYQDGARKKSLASDVRNAVPAVEQCIADNGGTYDNDKCGGTFTTSTADKKVNVSAGNQVVIAGTAASYTITGTREGPKWKVVYSSSTGKSVETES